MLLYFFTLQLLGYRIFRWLFNFTISWLSNFTKFWWYKVTYYNAFIVYKYTEKGSYNIVVLLTI